MYEQIIRYACLSAFFVVLLDLGGNSAWSTGLTNNEVRINGIVVRVSKEVGDAALMRPSLVAAEERKWIIKFAGPIRTEEKREVEELGCQLHDYLPDFAYLATMNDDVKNAVTSLGFIVGVAQFLPDHKIQEGLRAKILSQPSGKTVRVHLKLAENTNLPELLALVKNMQGTTLEMGHNFLRIEIDSAAIAGLAAIDEVIWIDEHFDMRLFNDTTRWVIQSNIPGFTRIWDHGIRGEGQIVGIGDTGLDYDMPWFRDPSRAEVGLGHRKVIGYDTTYGDDYDANYPGHGTHVAGTVAGDRTPVDGLSAANGMAPKAKVFIHDLSSESNSYVFPPDDLGLMFLTAYNSGVRLHTNSWGNSDRSYSYSAASADRFTWDNKDFLVLFSCGNSGPGLSTIGNSATAKNVISVGATYNGASAENMASFSSNGPTADGRIKPTVTAPGYGIVSADSDGLKSSFNSGTMTMSGTSMATPAVAGAAALVSQYFSEGFYPFGTPSSGNAFTPSAALIKAVIINSAMEMFGTGVNGRIPSTGQGWGRVNLAATLTFSGEAGKLAVADESAGVATDGTWSRQFMATGAEPLKVTLVWSDYPGASGAERALVNDLDLTVMSPDGRLLTGNAFANGESFSGATADRLNVEEQVLLKNPLPGIYTVTVTGYNIPQSPQPFAIAVSGSTGVTSRGLIVLDKRRYNAGGRVQIRVADRDLNRDPALAEQITINLASSTKPGGINVLLTETTPDSAVFFGIMPLAAASSNFEGNSLPVSDNDTITALYQDIDDGSGRAATVTALAIVDNIPPLITELAALDITDTTAIISWNTDEPANSALDFGETPDSLASIIDKKFKTEHLTALTNLREGVAHAVTARSADEAENSATSGVFTFSTLNLPPSLTINSSAGEKTNKSSTVISGISTDPSGVAWVSVNGLSASFRISDGYFQLAVPLQMGSNIIAVTASDSLGNTASRSIEVTRIHPPDVIMQELTGSQTARQGGTATINSTVCNVGSESATEFQVGFYLSGDRELSSNDILIGNRNVVNLAAGTCSAAETNLLVPVMAPGGSLFIIAHADYMNRLDETDKNNNILAGSQIALPYPQLTAPSPLNVPSVNSTQNFQVSWGVSNVAGATYILEYSKDGSAFITAYSGTNNFANLTGITNGTYSYRVRAIKTGYADSIYSATKSCSVALQCGAPAAITLPASNSTGSFQVSWNISNIAGATYILEYSRDGGAFITAYNGTNNFANLTGITNGTYSYRVRATKTGYADSAYSATKSCVVALQCSTPAAITLPAANSTGSFQVSWSMSKIAGTTYILECSKDGGNTFNAVYSGANNFANLTGISSGTYHYRVKSIKTGYADSGWKISNSITVCKPPAKPGVYTKEII